MSWVINRHLSSFVVIMVIYRHLSSLSHLSSFVVIYRHWVIEVICNDHK
jgi:hypothetical protein